MATPNVPRPPKFIVPWLGIWIWIIVWILNEAPFPTKVLWLRIQNEILSLQLNRHSQSQLLCRCLCNHYLSLSPLTLAETLVDCCETMWTTRPVALQRANTEIIHVNSVWNSHWLRWMMQPHYSPLSLAAFSERSNESVRWVISCKCLCGISPKSRFKVQS